MSSRRQFNYNAPGSKYHLHWEVPDITELPIVGFCKSGELFAILGHGNLKTSLLRTLAGSREYSELSSVQIFLDGTLQQISDDNCSFLDPMYDQVLYSNVTVLETLIFSAELRLEGEHHPPELIASKFLSEMGLEGISDTMVSNLSAWQKRILLFATEVVAGKDIIFFDNPTLDLDAVSALACITTLQRVARAGRLVAITASNLTFREYAIIDRIQLLSNDSAIFFGAASGAVPYFAKFGRMPSPGASISDFLLDLVEDVNSGYQDSSILKQAILDQNKIISRHFIVFLQGSTTAGSDSNGSNRGRRRRSGSFNYSIPDREASTLIERPYLGNAGGGERTTPLYVTSSASASASHSDDSRGEIFSVFSRCLQLYHWCAGCDCLETEEEDLPKQPLILKQFHWCLWRAFTIRLRNSSQLKSYIVFSGIILPMTFWIVFDSEIRSIKANCIFLTLLPFTLSILSVIWNDEDIKDRAVFAFERNRFYYFTMFFPICNLIADICVFQLLPCLTCTLMLYHLSSADSSFRGMYTFFSALFMIIVVTTSMAKAIFNGMALSLNFSVPKATLVTIIILILQLLYCGIFLDLSTKPLLVHFSLFYWGCGILYNNAFSHVESNKLSSDDYKLIDLIEESSFESNSEGFHILWLFAIIFGIFSVIVSAIFHRDSKRIIRT